MHANVNSILKKDFCLHDIDEKRVGGSAMVLGIYVAKKERKTPLLYPRCNTAE